MGGRDVAFALRQECSRRDGDLKGRLDLGPAASQFGEHPGRVAQVPGHLCADIRGRSQTSLTIRARGADLRRASQRLHAASGIAPGQDPGRCRFELCRHRLVGLDRRLGEMPRPAVGLIGPELGQRAVRGATLFCRRQVHDRRAHEGVAELEPAGRRVHRRQPSLLCWGQIAKAGIRDGARLEYPHITRAVERHEQQEPPRPGRQIRDSRSEQRLQSSAERECRREGVGGRPEGRPERHRELQERERVALRIHEDAAASRRGKVRVAGVEQLAGRSFR